MAVGSPEVVIMAVKTDTEVIIGGKVFTLSGYESEEYLQKVAAYLNNKLSEYTEDEGFKRLPLDTQSVLIQLNIADDYFKAKSQLEEVQAELAAKDTEMYDIKHELIAAQIKLESKEKLIWASYFARFNGSRLHVLHEQYNDSGLRAKLDNNMRFLDKFFASLKVGYETEIMPSVANFPDREAAKQASQKGYGLLVCLTTDTRELDVVDWFIGVQETRVVKNKQQLPVLFINPRDDLYVLCD